MIALGGLIFGTILLAGEMPQEPETRLIMWDAQYYVVLKGTVTELSPNAEGTFSATVVEAPDSGVGVSEDPGQRNVQLKLGAPF